MKLFYRSYGNGPPLIILHGLYGSSDNWISVARMISDTYTVYLPDLRNHGQSPHSDIMDYDAMRNDISELADQLGLKKFFLAGHSMGGKVAMAFAMKFPERLSGLLVVDISPFRNELSDKVAYKQHSLILNTMQSLVLSKIRTRKEAETELAINIDSDRIRGFIMKNLGRASASNFKWKLNVPVLINNLDKIMEGIDKDYNPGSRISGFPVIFLKGEESDYISTDDYNRIKMIFPAAEITAVAKAGHWLHSDQPGIVAENLRKLSGND